MLKQFQSNQPATRLITPGNGAIEGIQRWSLLLADWTLSNGRTQAGLGE